MTEPKLVQFEDGLQAGTQHAQFQEWRQKHPEGFFLNRKTSANALLHTSLCDHPGNTEWGAEIRQSLTAKQKICAETVRELEEWAKGNGVAVEECRDCAPRFHQEMLAVYEKVGRETGYWARRFLGEVRRKGGLATAKRMLKPPHSLAVTPGWQALIDFGRPELSVESSALKTQFRSLFTQAEQAEAARRLASLVTGRIKTSHRWAIQNQPL